jgi:hypothetical protein
MARQTSAEVCKRHGSQGAKVVRCVRCGGDIPDYAGRRVAELRETYAHHPGQCTDTHERQAAVRQVAGQASFAWECRTVAPGVTEPDICSIAGMGRESAEAYAGHMRREHGATALKPAVPPIRLRKGVPAAPRQAPRVAPFKRIAWTTTEHMPTGEHHPAELGGGPVYREVTTGHRGQFWANGPDAHSVIVIEDMRGTGRPNRLVTLYQDSSGTLAADWSSARSDRRDANRRERDRQFWSERAAS